MCVSSLGHNADANVLSFADCAYVSKPSVASRVAVLIPGSPGGARSRFGCGRSI